MKKYRLLLLALVVIGVIALPGILYRALQVGNSDKKQYTSNSASARIEHEYNLKLQWYQAFSAFSETCKAQVRLQDTSRNKHYDLPAISHHPVFITKFQMQSKRLLMLKDSVDREVYAAFGVIYSFLNRHPFPNTRNKAQLAQSLWVSRSYNDSLSKYLSNFDVVVNERLHLYEKLSRQVRESAE